MATSPTRRRPLFFIALLLVVYGCGGGDGLSGSSETTIAAPPASTATTGVTAETTQTTTAATTQTTATTGVAAETTQTTTAGESAAACIESLRELLEDALELNDQLGDVAIRELAAQHGVDSAEDVVEVVLAPLAAEFEKRLAAAGCAEAADQGRIATFYEVEWEAAFSAQCEEYMADPPPAPTFLSVQCADADLDTEFEPVPPEDEAVSDGLQEILDLEDAAGPELLAIFVRLLDSASTGAPTSPAQPVCGGAGDFSDIEHGTFVRVATDAGHVDGKLRGATFDGHLGCGLWTGMDLAPGIEMVEIFIADRDPVTIDTVELEQAGWIVELWSDPSSLEEYCVEHIEDYEPGACRLLGPRR